jgi:acetyl-CoA carboxylase biotin carboxyl carrier protein
MTTPLDHVATIAAWLAATDIDELELTGPDGHLRLRRNTEPGATTRRATAAPPETDSSPPAAEIIVSPGMGVLLHAHPLSETPLASARGRVARGQPLGLLRIGAVLQPVRSPRDGILARFLAPDGSLVGYGDALFELEPT